MNFAVNSICRRVKEQAMHLHEPMRAILPLQSAIRKLQPSSEYLTAIHADFLQSCLLSKCYKASLSILEDDIFEIDQKRTALVPRDFLLYCYYGYALFHFLRFPAMVTWYWYCSYHCRGMIYIGLKKFSKALEFFQHVLYLSLPIFALPSFVLFYLYGLLTFVIIRQLLLRRQLWTQSLSPLSGSMYWCLLFKTVRFVRYLEPGLPVSFLLASVILSDILISSAVLPGLLLISQLED